MIKLFNGYFLKQFDNTSVKQKKDRHSKNIYPRYNFNSQAVLPILL